MPEVKKVYSYITFLMLALTVFPVVEKLHHELGHLSEEHCGSTELHYCEAEHSCDICDYIFSATATPPENTNELNLFAAAENEVAVQIVSNTKTPKKYILSLRGPPVF